MYTKLIEYKGQGTTAYVYNSAVSTIFYFIPGPGAVVKSCAVEWRIGKGSVSNTEQRVRFRGPMEETYTISGILPQTGGNSIQLLEELSKRNSKYRLETLLTSPTVDGVETKLTAEANPYTTVLHVANATGLAHGNSIQLDTGPDLEEIRKIDAVTNATYISVTVSPDHVHAINAMIKQIEGVMVVINSLDMNQQEVKMAEAAGDSKQYIPFTLKLTRIRDDNCSGE